MLGSNFPNIKMMCEEQLEDIAAEFKEMEEEVDDLEKQLALGLSA